MLIRDFFSNIFSWPRSAQDGIADGAFVHALVPSNLTVALRVHPKSVAKMKNKIRELTDRNNGMSNTKREEKYQQYVRGWINYFKLADMKGLLVETDKWARRRIRAVYWKQWKRVRTRYRILRKLKLEHWQAMKLANSRSGYWRMAEMLNTVLTNKIIARLGYTSMLDHYLVVYEN